MTIAKTFKYLFPVEIKKALKYLWYSLEDFILFITGRRDPLYPPKRLNYVGNDEFKLIGKEFLNHFVTLGGLKTTDTILDIGSGIGRMAIPLTQYLSHEGKYFGFDIDKRGVEWCQKNIPSRYTHFHFEYADIYNKYYNKKGRIKATEFIFPYDKNKCDFIFATSVFTHMLPKQVLHYLAHINNVLKPGGTAFLTFFSLDETSKKNIKKKRSQCELIYPYKNETCLYSHKNVPEAEIGFDEEWIIHQLKSFDFTNIEIHHGTWSGREEGKSYQDIFICKKKTPNNEELLHQPT